MSHTHAGFPDTTEAYKILTMLFSPKEAALAVKIPLKPCKLSVLAQKMQEHPEQLKKKLDRLADRGLLLDLLNKKTGDTFYMLAPPVVGFIEMAFMRVRDDIPQKELANLLHTLLIEDKRFSDIFFKGKTQIGRALIHETAIKEEYYSDVLSYERATALIEESDGGAVSLCYCRHKESHRKKACDNPQEVCTSLYGGSEFVLRHGHGRPADRKELLDILAQSRERGLVQIADNVKNKPSYICHCCGCCCMQLSAINNLGITHAVHTSNFISVIDEDFCTGCGRCARRCPVGAITLIGKAPFVSGRHTLCAEVDDGICLGCGVCAPACNKKALAMVPRKKRVLTPESTVERVIRKHLENGTLSYLIFDNPESRSHAFINTLLKAILRLPAVQHILFNDYIQSRYIDKLINAAKFP